MYEGAVCPLCGSARRSYAPKDEDPVRLLSLQRFEAAMAQAVLNDAGIPCSLTGAEAAGLTATSPLRDVMVAFSDLARASGNLLEAFGEDSEIGRLVAGNGNAAMEKTQGTTNPRDDVKSI